MKCTRLLACLSITLTTQLFSQKKIGVPINVTTKPTTYNQIGNASGFSNANAATSDLFGKGCINDFGIPGNYMGNQDSPEGDYYFGIMTYKGDREIDFTKIGDGGLVSGKAISYRYAEYVQASIPEALISGKEYEVVIKISLADNSAYATKGFGVYFSDKQLSENSNKMLSVTPQVTYSEIIKDKTGWTEMKAKFKATGTEKFAVIGCFGNGYAVENVGGGKGYGTVRAYYYISSISINEAGKPDRDKDGVPDDSDPCPDVAGLEKFQGCPDSDNDGVEDRKDPCPKVAGLEKFQGCPDSDNDGIADNKDNCPTVAGVAKYNGCPDNKPVVAKDSDNDGIADSEDRCPNEAGIVANSGCPEVKIDEKAKEVFAQAMTGIQFESGKDIIKPSSYTTLDNVVDVLKNNPTWKVEVQGHTDNVGKPASNKALSQKRASAVKKYLMDKGIDGSKLTPIGYGPDRPIANNKTTEGKAKNRRVQFNVTEK